MRLYYLAAIFAVLATGCSTTSTAKIQPTPRSIRDSKTPVAMAKPSVTQRITAQRLRDAQTAKGRIAVEGPVVK